MRLAMQSVARTVITPMQDVLGLGAAARMNRPSIAAGNWEWRLLQEQLTPAAGDTLLHCTHLYGRE
jgi:4-alpha-glucanotransferase